MCHSRSFIVIPSKAGGFVEEVVGILGSLTATVVSRTLVLTYNALLPYAMSR